ncbi:hypothetical protein CO015_01105 [candidate division WWE3 bacterium CG_4_8_14_3_um_filter_42_11]|uniref:Integrase catalytic domain-containing protein n=1 Tax=candidate division WWE3 bacterium CG_4_8_14_3_um_filter_42_11 TaxID=1975076 RepID=A0A2M8G7R8_UNCKA|nr:MAG: hypothetical protein CO015_01105 [candidate division WWE3 bacterium CG_4_8_14_3_um_filter_42_11]
MDWARYSVGDLWSSDLTYLKFQGRFLYLAIIKDIVSREIIAFNLSTRHDSDLVLKTLKEALLKTNKQTNKLLSPIILVKQYNPFLDAENQVNESFAVMVNPDIRH